MLPMKTAGVGRITIRPPIVLEPTVAARPLMPREISSTAPAVLSRLPAERPTSKVHAANGRREPRRAAPRPVAPALVTTTLLRPRPSPSPAVATVAITRSPEDPFAGRARPASGKWAPVAPAHAPALITPLTTPRGLKDRN